MKPKTKTDKPDSIERLLALLRERGTASCTEVGETLWPNKANRQCYARPAGALIARAIKAGVVKPAPFRDFNHAPRYTLKHP